MVLTQKSPTCQPQLVPRHQGVLLPRSSHHWETGHGRETVRPGKGVGLSQSRRHTRVVNNSTRVSWFLGPEEKLCPQSLTFWGSKVTSESPRFWTSGLCGGWTVLWLHVLAERKHCQESSPTTPQGPDPDLGVAPAQLGPCPPIQLPTWVTAQLLRHCQQQAA